MAGERLRVATWNVERPKPRGWKVPPAQRRRMAEVDADIWVLTETHVDHAPTDAHRYSVFSPPHPDRRPEHERWAAIWSRWPMTPIEDPPPHRRGTVAAIADTPDGPVVIYGTVVAWANERNHDDGSPARMWEVHLAELDRQAAEWAAIRARHSGVPLVVAGDFNQDRDGSGWYGTRTTRDRLTSGLERAGLVCATADDVVAAGLLRSHHLVDHICVPADLSERTEIHCWENIADNGQRLSDHPVVALDLANGVAPGTGSGLSP